MTSESVDEYGCRNRVCRTGEYSEIFMEEDYRDTFTPKHPSFILGFANVGLVGTIAVNSIIEQYDLVQVAHVLSDKFPPVAVFYDGILKQPFRIYYSKEHDMIVSFCEIPLSEQYYTDIAHTLMGWGINVGVKDVVILQGLAAENPGEFEDKVFCAAKKEMTDLLEKHGIEVLPKGIILGLEATILNVCLNSQLEGYALMTPVNPQIPSPEGAAVVLEALNKVYDLDIKTEELRAEGAKIKQKMMEMMNQVQAQQMRDQQGGFSETKGPAELFT
jgi:uncharacterized protein